MACLLVLVVAATVLTGPPGKLTHAARTSPAEAFWRTAIPGAPLPEAIRDLLRPGAAGTKDALVDVRSKGGGDDPPPMNFKYDDYRSSLRNRDKAAAPSAKVLDRVAGGVIRNADASSPTVFFLEEAVRVGGILPFQSSTPRDTADETAASTPLRLYSVRAVRAVDGCGFVVCRRDDAGPDGPVYGCRATGPARAYLVRIAGGERGESTVAAAVVCHTDVSRRNRARAAFSLLDVKPGDGAAVCHAALGARVIPVKNDKSSSLSLV